MKLEDGWAGQIIFTDMVEEEEQQQQNNNETKGDTFMDIMKKFTGGK